MEEVLKVLPIKLQNYIRKETNRDLVQEIRIRINKPVIIYTGTGEKILDYIFSDEDMKAVVVKVSNYSLYAYEEEIRQGYITINGGHRVGIAGECIFQGENIRTIKNISSMNIRICREIKGVSNKIMKHISYRNRVYNTLILSPPKCGKTTILRDVARNISNGYAPIGLKGKKVCVIDERSEIAGCYNGVPQMDLGIRTDILDNCLKKEGMIMAIRSLSPEVIICDEIGTQKEIDALLMAFNSGINMIITLHGFDIEDIYKRKVFSDLINNSILERVIILSNRKGVGTVEDIYRIGLGGNAECLS